MSFRQPVLAFSLIGNSKKNIWRLFMFKKLAITALLLVFIAACGGGGGSSTTTADTNNTNNNTTNDDISNPVVIETPETTDTLSTESSTILTTMLTDMNSGARVAVTNILRSTDLYEVQDALDAVDSGAAAGLTVSDMTTALSDARAARANPYTAGSVKYAAFADLVSKLETLHSVSSTYTNYFSNLFENIDDDDLTNFCLCIRDAKTVGYYDYKAGFTENVSTIMDYVQQSITLTGFIQFSANDADMFLTLDSAVNASYRKIDRDGRVVGRASSVDTNFLKVDTDGNTLSVMNDDYDVLYNEMTKDGKYLYVFLEYSNENENFKTLFKEDNPCMGYAISLLDNTTSCIKPDGFAYGSSFDWAETFYVTDIECDQYGYCYNTTVKTLTLELAPSGMQLDTDGNLYFMQDSTIYKYSKPTTDNEGELSVFLAKNESYNIDEFKVSNDGGIVMKIRLNSDTSYEYSIYYYSESTGYVQIESDTWSSFGISDNNVIYIDNNMYKVLGANSRHKITVGGFNYIGADGYLYSVGGGLYQVIPYQSAALLESVSNLRGYYIENDIFYDIYEYDHPTEGKKDVLRMRRFRGGSFSKELFADDNLKILNWKVAGNTIVFAALDRVTLEFKSGEIDVLALRNGASVEEALVISEGSTVITENNSIDNIVIVESEEIYDYTNPPALQNYKASGFGYLYAGGEAVKNAVTFQFTKYMNKTSVENNLTFVKAADSSEAVYVPVWFGKTMHLLVDMDDSDTAGAAGLDYGSIYNLDITTDAMDNTGWALQSAISENVYTGLTESVYIEESENNNYLSASDNTQNIYFADPSVFSLGEKNIVLEVTVLNNNTYSDYFSFNSFASSNNNFSEVGVYSQLYNTDYSYPAEIVVKVYISDDNTERVYYQLTDTEGNPLPIFYSDEATYINDEKKIVDRGYTYFTLAEVTNFGFYLSDGKACDNIKVYEYDPATWEKIGDDLLNLDFEDMSQYPFSDLIQFEAN